MGVNCLVVEEEHKEQPVFSFDASVGPRQIERLAELKARRDAARVEQSLGALKQAARERKNLVPFVIDAVRDLATTGEIAGALRVVIVGGTINQKDVPKLQAIGVARVFALGSKFEDMVQFINANVPGAAARPASNVAVQIPGH